MNSQASNLQDVFFMVVVPACSDPGAPPDAIQHATSYDLESIVTYTCNRPGYKPDTEKLRCVMGIKPTWNTATPVCKGNVLKITI